MAILNFVKPENVVMLESSDTFGRFQFHPLEPGFGVTVGNALRRILLSSLEGYAITSLKIDGVDHEFDTIPGVIDDVTSIILNLKQVRLKRTIDFGEEKGSLAMHIENRTVLKAGDFMEVLSGFEVLNPDLVICNMDESAKFNIILTIEKGRGYIPADEQKNIFPEIGVIAIDSIFTPIKNVMYKVEPYRVENRTDYDELILEITTDGSIHPQMALKESASILIQHFSLFSDEGIAAGSSTSEEILDEEELKIRKMLKMRISDVNLSVRAFNCLKTADVETLGQLCRLNKGELGKLKNMGKKTIAELEELLDNMNLSFGMDLSKYKTEE